MLMRHRKDDTIVEVDRLVIMLHPTTHAPVPAVLYCTSAAQYLVMVAEEFLEEYEVYLDVSDNMTAEQLNAGVIQ